MERRTLQKNPDSFASPSIFNDVETDYQRLQEVQKPTEFEYANTQDDLNLMESIDDKEQVKSIFNQRSTAEIHSAMLAAEEQNLAYQNQGNEYQANGENYEELARVEADTVARIQNPELSNAPPETENSTLAQKSESHQSKDVGVEHVATVTKTTEEHMPSMADYASGTSTGKTIMERVAVKENEKSHQDEESTGTTVA